MVPGSFFAPRLLIYGMLFSCLVIERLRSPLIPSLSSGLVCFFLFCV